MAIDRRLILREGGPPQLVELPREMADALAGADVVQIGMADGPDLWEVSAGSQIGVVKVGGLQLVIEPKIAIGRLVFLMGYARRPSLWNESLVELGTSAGLPEALAAAFLRLSRAALGQGVLKGYRTVDETLPVLRGRVREADQLRRRWGKALPLEVRYDEFGVDIPENQLLVGAAEQLLRTPGLGLQHRAGLQRLRLQLADATAPIRGDSRPAWLASRLNARYQPALAVAELILDGRSFEQHFGALTVSGYLFNMATVFEDFVTVALREAMRPYGGRAVAQYRTWLDEAGSVPIRPDLVWLADEVPRAVVDAKYKAEKPSGFPQADLYQMLAYCTVLGLASGHLVYAKGEEPATTHFVRGSGTRVVAHTLDLAAPPQALLDSVATLAGHLAEPDLSDREPLPRRAAVDSLEGARR